MLDDYYGKSRGSKISAQNGDWAPAMSYKERYLATKVFHSEYVVFDNSLVKRSKIRIAVKELNICLTIYNSFFRCNQYKWHEFFSSFLKLEYLKVSTHTLCEFKILFKLLYFVATKSDKTCLIYFIIWIWYLCLEFIDLISISISKASECPTENKTHCMITFRYIHPHVLPLFTCGTPANGANFVVKCHKHV